MQRSERYRKRRALGKGAVHETRYDITPASNALPAVGRQLVLAKTPVRRGTSPGRDAIQARLSKKGVSEKPSDRRTRQTSPARFISGGTVPQRHHS